MKDAGAPVSSLGVASVAKWPLAVARLRRLIRSLKPDLIHTSVTEADIIGGIAGKLAGVPVVSSIVNVPAGPEWLLDNPRLNRLKMRWVGAVSKVVSRSCNAHHIAISQFVRDSAIERTGLDPTRTSVVYRGVPSSWFQEPARDALEALRQEVSAGKPYPLLLNVGRLMPQKGQRYLIEAMADVVRCFPKALLLIVGQGYLRDQLTELRDQLGLTEHVRFLGARTDVRALLDLCDIFVFPSLYEGLGVALVEAAGAGRPAIASRVGPLPEVVQDDVSGILVPPQSPQAIAEAVLSLAQDPERMRAMGRAAQQRARAMFNAQHVARQTDEVYATVLRPRNTLSLEGRGLG
jgi:glycosyltransferase involved in cell wall biosynthesis